MRYLAVSKTPFYIAYAFFNDTSLVDYGKILLKEENPNKRLVEWENKINDLIELHKPHFLLTHLLDKLSMMKKEIERIVEVRTILKLVCQRKNVMYAEFKTSGWEKRITSGRVTNFKKNKIISEGYEIPIGKDDYEVANAIILGEGVAWGRLQIGE